MIALRSHSVSRQPRPAFCARSSYRQAASSLSALAVVIAVSAVALFAQQGYAPGEIRLSSRPYFPNQSVLRVRTNEVQVNVVVRDFKTQPIAGLKASDFEVFDEGRPQKISGFSVRTEESASAGIAAPVPAGESAPAPAPIARIARPPRYVAIFFDDINTRQLDLANSLAAARKFISDAMGPRDFVAIFTASGNDTLDYMQNKNDLSNTLKRVRLHPRYDFKGEPPCRLIRVYEAYLIAEANDLDELRRAATCYGTTPEFSLGAPASRGAMPDQNSSGSPFTDGALTGARMQANQIWNIARVAFMDTLSAVEMTVRSLVAKPGSRTLLMTSSGFISDPFQRDKDRIIDEALRAGVVINALDSKGLYAEAPGSPLDEPNQVSSSDPGPLIHQVESLGPRIEANNSVMAEFADATGGKFIHNSNDLVGGIRDLAGAPSVTYVLGFVPENAVNDGKFHKLQVRLLAPAKGSVQARAGYFAPTKEEAARPTPAELFDREVTFTDSLAQFPATVTSRPLKSSSAPSPLAVTVQVDLRPLEFQKQQDREVQQLNLIVALFDLRGNFVVGKQGEIDLALKPDSFKRLESTGVNGSLNLEAPPGAYRLRTVAQEAVTGKLMASSQPITLH